MLAIIVITQDPKQRHDIGRARRGNMKLLLEKWNNFLNEQKFSQQELLAGLLLGEAGGEGREGMIAVYQVLLNRSAILQKHPILVAKESKQFSILNDMSIEELTQKMKSHEKWFLAMEILESPGGMPGGKRVVGDSTHYYNSKKAQPNWGRGSNCWVEFGEIGNHVFGKYMGDPMYGNVSDGKGRCYEDKPKTHPKK